MYGDFALRVIYAVSLATRTAYPVSYFLLLFFLQTQIEFFFRIKIFGKSLAFIDGVCVPASSPISNRSGTFVELIGSSNRYNITGTFFLNYIIFFFSYIIRWLLEFTPIFYIAIWNLYYSDFVIYRKKYLK